MRAIDREAEEKAKAVIDLLRELLLLRENLQRIEDLGRGYGYADDLPEVREMQKLEREVFEKVAEWEKPD